MGFFDKLFQKDSLSKFDHELMLPFVLDQTEEDNEAGTISINAYGDVFGEPKSCYATYGLKKAEMYDNGDYEAIVKLLKDNGNKSVRVLFQMKNGKAKDFRIDLDSLASLYQDDRFAHLDLLGWGLNDRSDK